MEWTYMTGVLPVLTLASGILLLIQLVYYLVIYRKPAAAGRKKESASQSTYPPLSVILFTKDTGSELARNLPLILEQDYPDFEVIVVNDRSAGEDEDILKRLDTKYTNLYYTFIPETARYVSRKKLGIAMGIRASRHEWVVMTNPDCRPASNQWLKRMAEQFTPETDIVLGYAGYEPQKSWFARKVMFDATLHSMRFLGQALCGMPYMGSGRNLAYRKSAYQSHKGFAHHLNLMGGEDDLLVNEMAGRKNTRVACCPESVVRTGIPPYKRMWMEEKVGMLVTGKHYKGGNRLLNGFETCSRLLFLGINTLVFLTGVLSHQWLWAGAAFLMWSVRTGVQQYVFHAHAKAFGEKSFCLLLPLYDWLQPLWSASVKVRFLRRNKSDFLRR